MLQPQAPDQFLKPLSFPAELILEIMSYCSPYDILQIQLACQDFREILRRHPQCWVHARYSFPVPVPAPPLGITAAGNWSESAYAMFIFGGGPCSWCKQGTPDMPISFSLRLRVCSDACGIRLDRGNSIQEILPLACLRIHKKRHLDRFRSWLPYAEGSTERFYASQQLRAAEAEYFSALALEKNRISSTIPSMTLDELKQQWSKREAALPIIMVNAEELLLWSSAYQTRREQVETKNAVIVENIAKLELVKHSALVRSPTLRHHLEAYSRDLSIFDHRQAWWVIRETVLGELRQAKAGNLTSGYQVHPNDRIRCLHCPLSRKLFTPQALFDHKSILHPDIANESPPGPKTRCTICHYSQKLFGREGLKQHIRAKHPQY